MPAELSFPFPLWIAGLLVAVFVVVAVLAWRAEKARVAAIARIAADRGLAFLPARDRELSRRYEHLAGLPEGGNRYAENVLAGELGGRRITAFEFHAETRSTDAKGNSTTNHHYRQIILVHLERTFPTVVVAPEGLLSKLAQAFGYDDIDFESHEFSRRFCVRSRDKRFAYDVCHPRMIEFLLARPDARFEIAGDVLAFVSSARFRPAQLPGQLDSALAIRDLMPAHVFAA